jgi:hypothetical protein
MPKILQHQSSDVTKMLLIGDTGTGKTGCLYSLAEAGYNLRILDLDNGADILLNLARAGKPEVADRIIYETVTEKFKTLQGKPIVDGVPKQLATALTLLDHWKVAETKTPDGEVIPAYDLGKLTSWGPDDVLVLDSLTMLSSAAMRHVLSMNGRLNQHPQQQDWGQAMQLVEDMLALLYSTSIKCNVIVISHITYLGADENSSGKGYPNTLGQKLPPKVGRYFNSMVQAKVRGVGPGAKRLLVTQPDGMIDLKNPAPLQMPKDLPIETGLATFFEIVRSGKPGQAKAAPAPKAA